MTKMILLAIATISGFSAGILPSTAQTPCLPIGPCGNGGAPAPQSKAWVSSIAPDDWNNPVTCEAGNFVHSALATTPPDNGVVPIVLVDTSLIPIPRKAWTAAFGFKLASKPNGKVDAILICGN
jgi:hypothetical protein